MYNAPLPSKKIGKIAAVIAALITIGIISLPSPAVAPARSAQTTAPLEHNERAQ